MNVKKTVLIFALLPLLATAQITPGKYLIKLAATATSLDNQSGRPLFMNTCSNVERICKNQIWELTKAAGRPGYFTIKSIEDSKFLTYGLEGTVNQVSLDVKLQAKFPRATQRQQYFLVSPLSAGGYTIQPDVLPPTETANGYYLSARRSSMQWENCPVQIDDRVPSHNSQNVNNLPYDNIVFTLEVAPQTVNIGPGRVVPESPNKLEVDITTGSDNLEPKSTQHNAEIIVILKNRPDVIKQNINEGREWPGRSTRRIVLTLPTDITENDIKELHLYRKRDGLQYVWQLLEKDNWNVDRVRATAVIVSNGVSKRVPMLETGATRPRVPGASNQTYPLYRFIYEGGDGINEGQFFKLLLEPMAQGRMPEASGTKNANVKVTFGTGGDDLRGGGDNVNVTIRFKSSTRVLTINNINQTKKLNNFTEETFSKEIPNSKDVDLNDIKEVELRHTGGGGFAADNWHVDKIYIVINKDGINKVLVDKVAAPIHMFTGETRSKKFIVPPTQ